MHKWHALFLQESLKLSFELQGSPFSKLLFSDHPPGAILPGGKKIHLEHPQETVTLYPSEAEIASYTRERHY